MRDLDGERDVRNLNDTECPVCGEEMTYAHGFGWVCQNCVGG
jgi:hypothetical protein